VPTEQALTRALGVMSYGVVKWFSPLRKLIIGIIGGTVLLVAVALIVLPGPAFIVIPIGLAILATEFAWAQSALGRARSMVRKRRKSETVAP
jgi:Putative transmembrane protein (PGPGW)